MLHGPLHSKDFLYLFPKVIISFILWSSWIIQQYHCKKKLDVGHTKGLKEENKRKTWTTAD